MKILTFPAILTVLLTLSATPSSVLGASVKRDRCMARPSGHGKPSITTNNPAPSPAPPKSNPIHTARLVPPPAPPVPASSPKPTGRIGPDPSSTTSQEDVQAYLSAHNTLRVTKGADPLAWNDTLAAYAQQVADTCDFKHSGGPYGENLSAGTHSFSIDDAIKLWTDEESSYDPNNPQPSHYTQVVWKGSNQVGCAVTACSALANAFDNADYYVCEYYPPGNFIGEFPQNVEP